MQPDKSGRKALDRYHANKRLGELLARYFVGCCYSRETQAIRAKRRESIKGKVT